MKKRIMGKLKQVAILSVILGCLLCAFYLSMEEIPSLPECESLPETTGYIAEVHSELRMEDARELSTDLSRTIYLRQNSFKKPSISCSRLILAACICMLLLTYLSLASRTHSKEAVLYSHTFLIDYIHHQDGEK